jgi:hypothetical protein
VCPPIYNQNKKRRSIRSAWKNIDLLRQPGGGEFAGNRLYDLVGKKKKETKNAIN